MSNYLIEKQRMMKMKGFTLIEIMVVVVIIGILAMVVVPSIVSRPDEARIARARQDVNSVVQALDLYRLDNGYYPSQQQGIQALVTKPTTDPVPRNWSSNGYLAKLPEDPWGHAYQYRNPGQHNTIDVFSYGSAGEQGGENGPTVIGNWQ